MKQRDFFILTFIISLVIHFFFLNIPFLGELIRHLVVSFHEIWHWLWALLTWWDFKSLEINSDWSWMAITSWWNRAIILISWFLWSLIIWNLFLRFSLTKKNSTILSLILWVIFITLSIVLARDLYSLFSLLFFWLFFLFFFKYNQITKYIFSTLWFLVIFNILLDFNVWPLSDIWKFAEIFIILPTFVWMYIWLIFWLGITIYNFKQILQQKWIKPYSD